MEQVTRVGIATGGDRGSSSLMFYGIHRINLERDVHTDLLILKILSGVAWSEGMGGGQVLEGLLQYTK